MWLYVDIYLISFGTDTFLFKKWILRGTDFGFYPNFRRVGNMLMWLFCRSENFRFHVFDWCESYRKTGLLNIDAQMLLINLSTKIIMNKVLLLLCIYKLGDYATLSFIYLKILVFVFDLCVYGFVSCFFVFCFLLFVFPNFRH